MRTTICTVSLFVALLMIAVCPMMAKGEEPTRTVVFNELMWMGSSLSGTDEWIELRNTADSTVVLSGWLITKFSSGNEIEMLTIPEGKSISPYGVFLISNYDSSSSDSKLNVELDLVDSDVSLVDTALQLKLYAIDGTDTTLVDVADDGSGSPLAGHKDNKHSMIRNYCSDPDLFPKADDGTISESWDTATHAKGWDDGAIEKGTPGFLEPAVLRIAFPDTVVYRATVEVPILVENIIDLYSANLTIAYEDEYFEYVSTEEGSFLDSTQTELLVSEDADEVNVGIARMEPNHGVSGSGTVATLSFRAITANAVQTHSSFNEDTLRDSELGLIWVSSMGDTVTIDTLAIIDTSPDESDSNVIASAPVAATFDHHPACAMDSTKFYLYLTSGSDTLFSGVEYDSASHSATLPDSVLLADTLYTALLDSSIGMTDNTTWTFRTSVLGDIFDLDDPTDADGADDYIGDGLVDGDDLAVLGYFYYTTPASDRWSPVADLDRSGRVDGGDLTRLGINYGRTSSTHAPKIIAQDEDAPLLRIAYDEGVISEGKTCVVTVIGERMHDVYALDIGIGFDEGKWEMARVEKGALLGVQAAVIHGWDGSLLRIGATQLGRVPGVDGDGAMLRVTFRAKQNAPPVFQLGRAALRDSELKLIPVRIGPAVSVGSTETSDLPEHYALSQNVPNPFNPNTEILYALPEAGDVRLRIYSTAGQCVRTLVDGRMAAGRYKAHWDGRDERGRDVATGVYFYLLTVRGSDARLGRKMLLLR